MFKGWVLEINKNSIDTHPDNKIVNAQLKVNAICFGLFIKEEQTIIK